MQKLVLAAGLLFLSGCASHYDDPMYPKDDLKVRSVVEICAEVGCTNTYKKRRVIRHKKTTIKVETRDDIVKVEVQE